MKFKSNEQIKLVENKESGEIPHLQQLLPSKLRHKPCLCIKNNCQLFQTNLLQQQQTSDHLDVTPLNQNRSHITMWTLPLNKEHSHTKNTGMFLFCHNLLQLITVIKHRNMGGSSITLPFGVPDNNLI
jgi:hypothetical protein